jgi:uncharacterized protein (DUF58 family)
VNPLSIWRQRLQHWFESRLPLTDSLILDQRSVYILPTRAGWMLLLTLLVLLAASINYQLNLGYLLTFLLGGCALVATLVAHETLRGLALHALAPQPQFAHASVTLTLALSSRRRGSRHGIGVCVRDLLQWSWVDVPPLGSSQVQVAWLAPQRGWHRVPTLMVETRFPIGTFRVWTVWRPAAQVLIFPAPEAHAPVLPMNESSGRAATPGRHSRQGIDFDGVRPYQRGDALKQIVWKKLAKADQLVSREHEHVQGLDLWLDYSRISPSMDAERKLSRLCAWVLQADQRELRFGLRVPGQEVPLGSGAAHKRKCLEVLATC